MNIKAVLKKYDTTLSELSNYLFISRPTLNTYIELYEQGNLIPNEKYQIVFDNLFKKELEQDKFKEYVCRLNNMITKDELLGTTTLNPLKTNTIYFLIEEMRKDLYNDDSNENVYIFIRMLLSSYHEISVFQELINYFLSLNGIIDINKFVRDEQEKLSVYYHFFDQIKQNQINYSEDNYLKKFKERIGELEIERKKKEKELGKNIEQKIKNEINKQIETGKSIDKITMKDILDNVEN